MYSFPDLEPVCCFMSSSNCCFFTCIRFLRRQVRWSGISISWRMFHTLLWKGFSIVNEAEVNVFLELSCFFDDPTNVGNLISGSSAFSKTSLHIWEFSVQLLLKPSLETFEHYFASVWDECNCTVVWTFFGIGLSLRLERKLTFSRPVATAEFSKCAGIMSAALSQHHLLGFEIAQLESHHLY